MTPERISAPKLLRPGDPISAEWLNSIAQAVLQRITIIPGRTTRRGNSLLLEVDRTSGGGGSADARFLAAVTSGSRTDAGYLFAEQELVRGSDGVISLQDKAGGRSGTCWNVPELGAQTHDLFDDVAIIYTWVTPDTDVETEAAATSTTTPATSTTTAAGDSTVYTIDVPLGGDGSGDWIEAYWLNTEQLTYDGCICVGAWWKVKVKMRVLAIVSPPTCTGQGETGEQSTTTTTPAE